VRRLAVAALLVFGCGPGSRPAPAPPAALTPKQIVERSKPAIVRIEAGDERVGTGFVIDPAGVVVTNLHVVAAMDVIRVKLLDGTTIAVDEIVAFDPEHDLALLRVARPTPLPALPLGDSAQVAAGDPVLAIGNPLGVLDYTVSDGLISSVRQLAPGLTLLQISAPISQGSSGGPLFNAAGEVIGVSTAVFTEGQNLNFGVPSNDVAALAKRPRPMAVGEFAAADPPARPRDRRRRRHDRPQGPRAPGGDLRRLRPTAVAEAVQAIDAAISIGAPVYNRGDHEGCFKIYQATSTKLEASSSCAGIRDAFGAGLLRVGSLTTPAERAWALRDTFDGLLTVAQRWARRPTP
jgi:serine protease Do